MYISITIFGITCFILCIYLDLSNKGAFQRHSQHNKLYNKHSQTKSQKYSNRLLRRNWASPTLLPSSMRKLPRNFLMLYYSLHFLISPAMPLSLPWDLRGDIETHRSPSARRSALWGSQRETRGLPQCGAEQHMGEHPPHFALAARDRSTAAAPRLRRLGPDAQRSAPTRRTVPPKKKVEGWDPSSHKVPMREAQASLAPCPCGDKPRKQCLCVLKRQNPLKHTKYLLMSKAEGIKKCHKQESQHHTYTCQWAWGSTRMWLPGMFRNCGSKEGGEIGAVGI